MGTATSPRCRLSSKTTLLFRRGFLLQLVRRLAVLASQRRAHNLKSEDFLES